jgi:hypothetical protein
MTCQTIELTISNNKLSTTTRNQQQTPTMPASTTNDLTLFHVAGVTSMASNIVLNWTGQSVKVVKPASSAKELADANSVQQHQSLIGQLQ